MKLRWILLCVTGAVVIAISAWLVVSFRGSDSDLSREGNAVASTLENLGDRPSNLAAKGVEAEVSDGVAAALPAGTVIDADEATWTPDGVGGGTMQVAVSRPGAAPIDYLAVVVKEAGAWKVLATMDVQ